MDICIRYTVHYLCYFFYFSPSFGSKVKIMPRCHHPVCVCLNQICLSSFLLLLSLISLPRITLWLFACPAALQSPPSPSRGPNQRPESYLFRLSQREEKKKGLFIWCSRLLLCATFMMSWINMWCTHLYALKVMGQRLLINRSDYWSIAFYQLHLRK